MSPAGSPPAVVGHDLLHGGVDGYVPPRTKATRASWGGRASEGSAAAHCRGHALLTRQA